MPMSQENVGSQVISKTSRRRFLKEAASFTAAAPRLSRAGQTRTASRPPRVLAYVGTYSLKEGPPDYVGNGQGICLFEMNPATGALSLRETFASASSPAWLAFDPTRTHLYSANEIISFEGANSGSVSAYKIDRSTGGLTLLNTVSSEGAGPSHMSVHPSGKFALVANYMGGTVAVLAIGANGELGPATDVFHDQGTVGPEHASSAPPGSFAISGHEQPHAHMVQSDPSGRYVFACDLALDRTLIWKFDAEKGKLTPNDPPAVAVPPGDGPRHFAFHPSGRWFYSVQEEASTVAAYDYDSTRGKLTPKQTVSTLPKGFAGTNFPAEIMTSADGKFLYACNRVHDSIAWFSIGAAGTLTLGGVEWTRGDYPRHINLDPTGNYMFSCNQKADAVTAFRVNRNTGALTFTGLYTPVGTPGCIVFLT
jgi:6-phosphogluconolactonase